MEEAIEEKSLTQIQYEKVLKELEAHNENGKKIKSKKRKLEAQLAEEARKKHTRNMVEIGELIYNILGRDYQNGDPERLTSFLKSQENRGNFFSKAMNGEPEKAKADSHDWQVHQMSRNHFSNVDDVLDDISKNQK